MWSHFIVHRNHWFIKLHRKRHIDHISLIKVAFVFFFYNLTVVHCCIWNVCCLFFILFGLLSIDGQLCLSVKSTFGSYFILWMLLTATNWGRCNHFNLIINASTWRWLCTHIAVWTDGMIRFQYKVKAINLYNLFCFFFHRD